MREVVCTIQDQVKYLKKAVEHTIELSKEKSLVVDPTGTTSLYIIFFNSNQKYFCKILFFKL